MVASYRCALTAACVLVVIRKGGVGVSKNCGALWMAGTRVLLGKLVLLIMVYRVRCTEIINVNAK